MYINVIKNAHVSVLYITAQKRTQRRTFIHAKKKLHPFDTIETFSWRNSVEHYYQVLHKDDCVNHVNENTVGVDIVPTNWMMKPYNIHNSESFLCQLFVANIKRPVGVFAFLVESNIFIHTQYFCWETYTTGWGMAFHVSNSSLLEGQRQEGHHDFKASLSYRVRPYLKNEKGHNKNIY